MKACATAGGGVMFIPDTIERKQAVMSYADLLKDERQQEKKSIKIFGKRSVLPVRKTAAA
jgi:hypothetical protein